jgi:hypothetical protein
MHTQKDFSLVYKRKLLLEKTYNELKEHFDESYTYIKVGDHFKQTEFINFLKNYGKIRFKKMLLKEQPNSDCFITIEAPERKSAKTEIQYLSKMQVEILIDILEIHKGFARDQYFDYSEIFDHVHDYLEYTKGKVMKNMNPWSHYKALKEIEESIRKNHE